MAKTFEAEILSAGEALGSDKHYIIPNYQRPYAWEEGQTRALLNDLWNSFSAQKEEYFLSNIFLIKAEGEPAQIIDGQQRLTTLTILLALLGKLSGDESAVRPALMNGDSRLRLKLRSQDREFFGQIQAGQLDTVLAMQEAEIEKLPESQRRIAENTQLLAEELGKRTGDKQKLAEFVRYILDKAVFCVVSCADILVGAELFQRINATGLRLTSADILKAFFLGKITNEDEQEAYAKKWEGLEEYLDTGTFERLLSYVRLIITEKDQTNLVRDYQTDEKLRNLNPKILVDSYLTPYAKWLKLIVWGEKFAASDKEAEAEINKYVQRLGLILDVGGSAYWLAAVVHFFHDHSEDAKLMARFLKIVERYVTVAFLGSRRASEGEHQFYMKGIEQPFRSGGIEGLERHLRGHLKEWYERRFVDLADGDIYGIMPQGRTKYLMLLVNSLLAKQYAVYVQDVSIEHILPQNVSDNNNETSGAVPWAAWWPNEEKRKAWLNRLGNLALLTNEDNSTASNRSFKDKQGVYFNENKGGEKFALTRELKGFAEWTEREVSARQDELVGLLCREYGIDNWREFREPEMGRH